MTRNSNLEDYANEDVEITDDQRASIAAGENENQRQYGKYEQKPKATGKK